MITDSSLPCAVQTALRIQTLGDPLPCEVIFSERPNQSWWEEHSYIHVTGFAIVLYSAFKVPYMNVYANL